MDSYFRGHGSQHLFIRSTPVKLQDLIAELGATENASDNKVLEWV